MSEQTPLLNCGQASNPTAGQPPVQLPAGVAQPQASWKIGPDGQPQMFSSTVGMQAFQPVYQAVPYNIMPVQPVVQPMTAIPPSLQPYSFLALSLAVMITCAILNITSLLFGIPAVILSVQSEEKKHNYQYEGAKRFGAIALGLSVLNIIYTFIIITLAIGLGLGLALEDCYDDYYYDDGC